MLDSAVEPATGLLYPLDAFFVWKGFSSPWVRRMNGEAIPEPYRSLLVHRNDMTPTLEAHHREPIVLRLLERIRREDRLYRQVALMLSRSGVPVEYGAIVIHCDRFPPAAREEILECRCPLGTILARHDIRHNCRPSAFFEVETDKTIREGLELRASCRLFGRRNTLIDSMGAVLAEVVEILPPMTRSHLAATAKDVGSISTAESEHYEEIDETEELEEMYGDRNG